uniref:Uncharacterized protein n=1 Tax=viral metagenome TaxID=1070528 RepID=A0A6M3XVH3_9ZZZZ
MSRLLNSWELKDQLNEITMSTELKTEIDKFIKSNEVHGVQSFSNIIFRGNLHYIIDNINNPKLLKELTNLNAKGR